MDGFEYTGSGIRQNSRNKYNALDRSVPRRWRPEFVLMPNQIALMPRTEMEAALASPRFNMEGLRSIGHLQGIMHGGKYYRPNTFCRLHQLRDAE